jgi:hypothetical protein
MGDIVGYLNFTINGHVFMTVFAQGTACLSHTCGLGMHVYGLCSMLMLQPPCLQTLKSPFRIFHPILLCYRDPKPRSALVSCGSDNEVLIPRPMLSYPSSTSGPLFCSRPGPQACGCGQCLLGCGEYRFASSYLVSMVFTCRLLFHMASWALCAVVSFLAFVMLPHLAQHTDCCCTGRDCLPMPAYNSNSGVLPSNTNSNIPP